MRLLQKKSKKNEACVIRTRNLQDWNLTRYRCANAPSDVDYSEATANRI